MDGWERPLRGIGGAAGESGHNNYITEEFNASVRDQP